MLDCGRDGLLVDITAKVLVSPGPSAARWVEVHDQGPQLCDFIRVHRGEPAVEDAARVVDPGIPRPLAFGLDVTERAKLTPEHLERLATLAGDGDNAVVRFTWDALRFYFEFHSRYDGFYGAFLHDALAVAAALDPSLARTEALAVEVELEGRWTTGETVTDWRRAWGRAPDLDIAVEADIEAFFGRFVGRMGDLAAERGR